ITGYYDYKRAEEGIDPVTGEKLSTAERITAGAWAAAGFIPIVGWVGRIAKGGKAVYKIGKGMNAIHHTLDAYKTTKSLDYLRKSEKGIYGLLTATGLSEAVTGRDMFGNELTDEERKQSLTSGLLAFMTGGAAHAIDKGHLKLPYSQKYVKGQLAKAQATMKGMSRKIGKVEIPVPVRGPRLAAAGPDLGGFGLNMENRRLGDVWQNITANREVHGNHGYGRLGNGPRIVRVTADSIRRNIDNSFLDKMETAGGHTLERHVAKTNEELIKRAIKENVEAATTFTDKSTAIKATQENLRKNARNISEWLNNSETGRKVFDMTHSNSIGKGVLSDKKHVLKNLTKSRIVLVRDSTQDLGFRIVTSFPIPK
ncbi:putative toxin of predicted polymorphic toxin system, partial [Scopulibacillus darangshiensis]